MIGAVQRREADIALNVFTPTDDRLRVVDFSAPFSDENTVLIMHKPRSSSIFYFVEAFKFDVWLALIFAIIAMTLVVTTAVAINREKIGRHFSSTKLSWFDDMSSSFWLVLHSIFTQSTLVTVKPKSFTLQVLLAHWWLTLVLVVAAYNSVLTSTLAVRKLRLPVNSLDELAASSMTPVIVKDASIHGIMSRATDGVFKKLHSRVTFVTDFDDILNTVFEDSNAVGFYDLESFRMMSWRRPDLADRKCEISIADDYFLPYFPAFAMQKDSPLNEQFSRRILRLREVGVIQRMYRRYKKFEECDGSERRNPHEHLGIQEVFGVFCVFGIGVMLAILSLSCELIMHDLRSICKHINSF